MKCPYCGHKHDMHTDFEDHLPRPGDVPICIECAGLQIFVSDTELRKPTKDETDQILQDPDLEYIRTMINAVKKARSELN
jgi:hypothetical protein